MVMERKSLIVCYLKIQKIPLMKPIMSPRLQPATSLSSSWNPLPSHFSLRLCNLGQWHKICSTVFSSSSSSHNLQKSCVLPTPLPLKAPIEQCSLITPSKILILFLSSPNNILVAFGFNFRIVWKLYLDIISRKTSSKSEPYRANSSAISLPCMSQCPGTQHSQPNSLG
ncbi:hypothetical protein FF38_11992 [Lucilia cuprina]|uniref:Uncharacterized protein n=1 Tax=Lucilia cuprina TaxID=7375 RepID=A0A0L0CEE6_LUCCU|nr:hypothetical protein FF38_11992 [Lucilia cuprina]